jgi:methionine sulfoxide reductase catalytic subunit
MLIKKPDDIKSSEITDKRHYLDRRKFMQGALLTGSVAATGVIYRQLANPGRPDPHTTAPIVESAPRASAPTTWDLPGEQRTPFGDITHYNNFYEFSTDKRGVAEVAEGFVTRPWTVQVDGLVHKPKTFDLDDLIKLGALEERIYRLRCVEAWSMVIPWLGFPLATLLKAVEPLSEARFVRFTTLHDPKRMPGQAYDVLEWPYVEGLRLDEAMNELTLLSVGLYGEMLLPQNGAPIRLVVPWKYGFKSVKSIVRVSLVVEQPETTWHRAAPDEYGFYSNVNPHVDHPRWSQATERRIGEFGRRDTLLYNGYAAQVAHLYDGLDLKANF